MLLVKRETLEFQVCLDKKVKKVKKVFLDYKESQELQVDQFQTE